MENFCKGVTFGLVTGMVIGGIVVAKNKNFAYKIRKGLGIAEEKMQEAKEFVEEKVEEIKTECKSNNESCGSCEQKMDFVNSQSNKDFGKKSKN